MVLLAIRMAAKPTTDLILYYLVIIDIKYGNSTLVGVRFQDQSSVFHRPIESILKLY